MKASKFSEAQKLCPRKWCPKSSRGPVFSTHGVVSIAAGIFDFRVW
jgi:hypothetical protein